MISFPESPASFYQFETLARKAGLHHIVGIDEAGRGPLAGPVVAAAVSLPKGLVIEGLADSKKLSSNKRQNLYDTLRSNPRIHISFSVVSSRQIDCLNILRATHLAMQQAAERFENPIDFIFVDGLPVPGLPTPNRNIIKGDAKCASVAAASIIAKVERDKLMLDYDCDHPDYGFRNHKGYGTRKHLEALNLLGPCPIHRRSFAPVAKLISP